MFLTVTVYLLLISIVKWGPVIASGFGCFCLISASGQVYLCCDNSMIRRYSFKRGICVLVQSTCLCVCNLSVLWHNLGRWRSIVFLPFFWNLVLRHVSLFSSEKSVRCSPFLFDELCKQNLLLFFFTYSSIRVSTDDQNIVFGNTMDKGR